MKLKKANIYDITHLAVVKIYVMEVAITLSYYANFSEQTSIWIEITKPPGETKTR